MRGVGLFEDVHEFPVPSSNLEHCDLPRRLLGSVLHQRVPEAGPSDGKADEAGDAGGGAQPLSHLAVILTASEHDATHSVSTPSAGGGHQLGTVLSAVEPLNLPDVRFHPTRLELFDGPHHQPRTDLDVVRLAVTFQS